MAKKITDLTARTTPLMTDEVEVAASSVSYRVTRANFLASPRARVYHNAAQSIANLTVTKLAFNSERYDTDTIHDVSTNNTRLTCKTAGLYSIIGNVTFASNATGIRFVRIILNNTTVIGAQIMGAVSGDVTVISISTQYVLAVNDYVDLEVYQGSGGALDVSVSANYSPEFMMAHLG